MKILYRLLRYGIYLALTGALFGALAIGVTYWLIAPRLPSVDTLRDVRLQVPLRVYSADGRLIATFGETRRIPARIEEVPDRLKQAFVAAEDADFYRHRGLDFGGITRAVWLMVTTGSKHVAGGSTITQQVARNFFLSSEVSFTRKISEMFLAIRIENTLEKDEILGLYLNKSFFGNRAYGVAAAAEFYYGKTLDQLSLAECAMLASIPKFPSTGNPIANRPRALIRRTYVLQRMLENRFIDQAAFAAADKEPDLSYPHEPPIELEAPYLAEMVRLQAIEQLGNDALTGGYSVHTTLQSQAQEAANRGLHDSLFAYDRRHGWRGAEAHVELEPGAGKTEWDQHLIGYRAIAGLTPGLVTTADATHATVYLGKDETATLDLEAVAWARPYINENSRGAAPKRVDAVVTAGDIVRLAPDDEKGWALSQLPKAQGALVALDPGDGAILALTGGLSFQRSKFNRATQSARQPGSSFKPFIYSAAFEHGFTPASVVNDAPLVFPDPSRPNGLWAPKNDDDSFRGPVRLREALTRSINLVSVRLLDAIGVRYAREYFTRFGFNLSQLPENLSMALGTAAVAPLDMARGYAVFANGGFLIDPYFVREIVDRDGVVVYRANPALACADCPDTGGGTAATTAVPPPAPAASLAAIGSAHAAPAPVATVEPRYAPRTIDVRNSYLITSMMRDVIRRGTGSAAMALKRQDLAGKTGTTNEHRDAWFAGFNAKVVAAAWTGFDDFSSLGRGEFGAKVALPVWMDFMRAALQEVPEQPFDMPAGVVTVRVDRASGALASAADPDAILEVLRSEDVSRLATQIRPAEENADRQREAYDVF